MWVRGLKQSMIRCLYNCGIVAPRVGAWIETFGRFCVEFGGKSHPVWVRGLKLVGRSVSKHRIMFVAPRVGAWIETMMKSIKLVRKSVAPRVGAWIETHASAGYSRAQTGRTPCGCVD